MAAFEGWLIEESKDIGIPIPFLFFNWNISQRAVVRNSIGPENLTKTQKVLSVSLQYETG